MWPDDRDLDDEMGAAFVLAGAAIPAALVPAARASRVDVLRALRLE